MGGTGEEEEEEEREREKKEEKKRGQEGKTEASAKHEFVDCVSFKYKMFVFRRTTA